MTITWDLFILLFFIVLTVYGMLLGKNRILGILVNLYIALAVTLVAGDAVYNFVSNFRLMSNNLATTSFGVKTLMLIVLTGLLTIKSEVAGLDSAGSLSTVQTGIYGFLTAGFVLSSAFTFMTNAQLIGLNSNFASLVATYNPVFVAAPALIMIGSAFFRK